MSVCAVVDLSTNKVVNLIVASIEDSIDPNFELVDVSGKIVQIGDLFEDIEEKQITVDNNSIIGNSSVDA